MTRPARAGRSGGLNGTASPHSQQQAGSGSAEVASLAGWTKTGSPFTRHRSDDEQGPSPRHQHGAMASAARQDSLHAANNGDVRKRNGHWPAGAASKRAATGVMGRPLVQKPAPDAPMAAQPAGAQERVTQLSSAEQKLKAQQESEGAICELRMGNYIAPIPRALVCEWRRSSIWHAPCAA